MSRSEREDSRSEAADFVRSFFEAGSEKDLTALGDFHAPADIFSKFDAAPPYTRQNDEQAFVFEQAFFANVSDFQYKIEDLKVDLIGGVAVATFYFTFKGVFVNDYSFEGRTVGSRSRVTMVLSKFGGSWKIVHEHFSAFAEAEK